MKFELPDVSELPDDCEWEVETGEVPVLLRGDDGTSRAGGRLWWDGKIHDDYDDDDGCCSCHISPPCGHCTSSWSDEAVGMVEEVGRAFFAAKEEDVSAAEEAEVSAAAAKADAEHAAAVAAEEAERARRAPLTVEQCARIALAAAQSKGMTVQGLLNEIDAARYLIALADSVGVLPAR